MISGVSSSNSYLYQSQSASKTETKLTDEQKQTIQDIISKYDPETASQDELNAMMEEIQEAGIAPSQEFGSIMNDAGFAPPEKPEDAQSSDSLSEVDEDLSKKLLELLQDKESGAISQEDIDEFIQDLKDSFDSSQGNFVNRKV